MLAPHAFDRLKVALAHKKQVIWDATCIRKEQREKLITLAENYSAFSSLYVFVGPIEQALLGNRNRDRQVPSHIIEKQYRKFEWPTEDEAHQVIYIHRPSTQKSKNTHSKRNTLT